ncbi:PREDICTED: plant cysteine oxidase 3 [Nelumbo nucifera]|uniref:cysteine dioxygenase n=2 Tax=Nelumbo nucifera TaxID=4432 RepID=A0A1U8A9W6_NELNU|nr:PREDICTED: plant cysteine oxidase 3 [Nelumbo nucifera]DAD35177.1 TPA_asm: hypothetical protein HUJ06_005817 [Nelumbo nucifera]
MTKNSSVQAIYDLCKKTFTSSGIPASPQSIQKLSSLLDKIGPSDAGLKEDNTEDDRGHGVFGLNHYDRAVRWTQPITYLDIYQSDSFTMCIFCLPTSSVIPLHDHPGMTVLSKVLYGSMHVKAYDWVEPAYVLKSRGPGYPPVRLAKLTVDKVITAPCGTSILYPKSGGNLHCFTGVTPCAVFDILTPPYQEAAGRKCTYYHDYPFSSFSMENGFRISDGKEEEYAWLEEMDTPNDLYMRQGEYKGPAIQP